MADGTTKRAAKASSHKLTGLKGAWPADAVERRSVASLIPYTKNARTHSTEQIAQIARSIETFGFTMPVLIDERGNLIAGHGRLLAAKSLKLDDVPTMTARGWTEAQKRAYVIADNKLALNADWDDDLLRDELIALSALEFDLDVIGFTEIELDDILAAPEIDGTESAEVIELTDAQKETRRVAWRLLLQEWRDYLATASDRSALTPRISKGTLAVEFVSALQTGSTINRGTSCCYTPHRLGVAGDKFALIELFDKALVHDNILDSIIWSAAGTPTIEKLFFGTLAIHGHRLPADFPSDLARDLIDEFCPAGGSMLDPCHGWGGRTLGFLLSNAKAYVGYDVDPRTHAGVKEMFVDLAKFVDTRKDATFVLQPFEDASLMSGSFDFALTSPPYFDVEKYEGDESSWKRYATLEAWRDGFYAPLLSKVAAALKPSAYFCLQIGNQSYPLEAMAKEIAKKLPLKYVETRSTSMRNNQAQTSESDGEVIVIFRKKATRITQEAQTSSASSRKRAK